MALTGDVNVHGIVLAPEEDGWGGLVVPSTDGAGIQLNVGDFVRAPNPTPGQNNLPSSPEIFGIVVAVSGNLISMNVPKNSPTGGGVLVYNLAASQCFQLYSGTSPGSQESTPAL